uniref:Methyltransferase type 11 domain-containing protein n=1 Tax=Bionectria ochroleuca TaxID=29856 RepID=A0A0B7KLF7_BIOOC
MRGSAWYPANQLLSQLQLGLSWQLRSIVWISVLALLLSAAIFTPAIVFALRNPASHSLSCFVSYVLQCAICGIILAWKITTDQFRGTTSYETNSHQPKERNLSASGSRSSSSITPAGDGSKATSTNSNHLPTFTSTSDSSLVTLASHDNEMTASEPKETTTDHYREVDWKVFENVKKWTFVEVTWDDSRPAFTIASSNKTVVLDWPRPTLEPRVSAVALNEYGSDISCEPSPRPNESQIYMRVYGAEMDRPPSKRPVCDVLDIGFGNEDCTISELEARHPEAQITTTEPMSTLAKRCRYIPHDENTRHWPFEENSFDLAIIRGTGGCINNPGKLFRNVSGSVRPGGYVEFWGISLPRTATDWLLCSKEIRAFHSSFSLTDDGICSKEMEAAGLSLVSISTKRVTLEKSNTQDLEKDLLDSTIVKLQELEKRRLPEASDYAALSRRMKDIRDELLGARSHVNLVRVIGRRPGTRETMEITWHDSASREYFNSLCERFLEPNVDGYSTYV